MIRPVMLMSNYNKKPQLECKKQNDMMTYNSSYNLSNQKQVAFSGNISDAFKIWKVCKKLPEVKIGQDLYKRLTMPQDLLDHNWEIVQAHKGYLQTIVQAMDCAQQKGFDIKLDEKVTNVLNQKNFDPYFKVKIPTEEKPVNLLDVFSRHGCFAKEQKFPTDLLLKIFGSDGPVPQEAYEKMVDRKGYLLTTDIMDNFRYRFMKTDIKKENPKMYKQVLNFYQKCLDNRKEYNTVYETCFAQNCNFAAKAHNKNYLEMLMDLKIGDKETFQCETFDKILRRMAEDVSPTDVETIRNDMWWCEPNPKRDRAKIHDYYLKH